MELTLYFFMDVWKPSWVQDLAKQIQADLQCLYASSSAPGPLWVSKSNHACETKKNYYLFWSFCEQPRHLLAVFVFVSESSGGILGVEIEALCCNQKTSLPFPSLPRTCSQVSSPEQNSCWLESVCLHTGEVTSCHRGLPAVLSEADTISEITSQRSQYRTITDLLQRQ